MVIGRLVGLGLAGMLYSGSVASENRDELKPIQTKFVKQATEYVCGDMPAFDTQAIYHATEGSSTQQEALLASGPIIQNICAKKGYSLTLNQKDDLGSLHTVDDQNHLKNTLSVYLAAKHSGAANALEYTIIHASKDAKWKKEQMEALLSIKTPQGPLIRNIDVYYKLSSKDIDATLLRDLVLQKDKSDSAFFAQGYSSEEVEGPLASSELSSQKFMNKYWPAIRFLELGGTVEMATQYMECERPDGVRPIDGDIAYRMLQLGYTPDILDKNTCMPKVENTKKSGAVLVLGRDWNDAFSGEKSIDFFTSLQREYDLTVLFTENRNEALEVTTTLEDDELAIIATHGAWNQMNLLSDPRVRVSEEVKSNSYFGFVAGSTDQEIFSRDYGFMNTFFESLSPTATVFYMSCSTATRTPSLPRDASLAAATRDHFLGTEQTLLAADFPWNPNYNLTIKNINPLEIEINDQERDGTFRSKGTIQR